MHGGSQGGRLVKNLLPFPLLWCHLHCYDLGKSVLGAVGGSQVATFRANRLDSFDGKHSQEVLVSVTAGEFVRACTHTQPSVKKNTIRLL